MPGHVVGITLSPKEWAAIGGRQPGRPIRTHECEVVLPDGSRCKVRYDRYQARSHRFRYQLLDTQQLWHHDEIGGGFAEVEAKAQELAAVAFNQAQQTEQQRMRRASAPACTTPPDPRRAPMTARETARLAGHYAVCLRSSGEQLMRIGAACTQPADPVEQLKAGRFSSVRLGPGQALVIGICCRWLRRWIDPAYLAERPCITAQPQADTKGESDAPRPRRRSRSSRSPKPAKAKTEK